MILRRQSPSKPRSKSFRIASESEICSAFAQASTLPLSSGDSRTPKKSSTPDEGRPTFRVVLGAVDFDIISLNKINGPDGSSNFRPALTTATCSEVANG